MASTLLKKKEKLSQKARIHTGEEPSIQQDEAIAQIHQDKVIAQNHINCDPNQHSYARNIKPLDKIEI